MDPKDCLQRIRDLIADGEYAEARSAVAEFRYWVASGGFASDEQLDAVEFLARDIRQLERQEQRAGRK